MTMHMYYWEDPGFCGYDYVALADCEVNARSKAINAYDGPPELKEKVVDGLQERPTGIFHYNSAIEIFTEFDPEGSLGSHQEWERLRTVGSEIRKIMETYRHQQQRNGFVDTPGGLEHMGDVWNLLAKWDRMLTEGSKSLTAGLTNKSQCSDNSEVR